MQTITVEIKKKTIKSAYSQMMLLNKLDFQRAQKGDPFFDLMMEIKRSIKKKRKSFIYRLFRMSLGVGLDRLKKTKQTPRSWIKK